VYRHVGNVKTDPFASCYATVAPEDVRHAKSTADYVGNGDTSEDMAGEEATMQEKLLPALVAADEKLTQVSLGSIPDDWLCEYFFGKYPICTINLTTGWLRKSSRSNSQKRLFCGSNNITWPINAGDLQLPFCRKLQSKRD
jgi:hypothetical protein